MSEPKSPLLGNPLKERDETLAVLDAWGDSYDRQGSGRTLGRLMVAALILAGVLLGVMAAFPGVLRWFTSL